MYIVGIKICLCSYAVRQVYIMLNGLRISTFHLYFCSCNIICHTFGSVCTRIYKDMFVTRDVREGGEIERDRES